MSKPSPYPGAPAWVKALGIAALVLTLLVLVVIATGGRGGHGPARHLAPAEQGAPQP